MISHDFIISLLLILTVAWGLGYLFSRLGLPVMLGELLAGIILGPTLLGWVSPSASLNLLADFGIFFAMFYAGMEMDPRETAEHLWPSVITALGGFLLPLLLGFLLTLGFGGTIHQSLYVGLGISVTAVAVQSVILKSMRINHTQVGHIIIGAAVVTDVFALIALSVLLGLARSGGLDLAGFGWLIFKSVAFFGVTIFFGEIIMPRMTRYLTDETGKGFTFALTIALAMAYLAEDAGLHTIIGAFLAGQFVRREIMDEKIYEAIADRFYGIAYGFLVPIFFASLAFHLHMEWSPVFIGFVLCLTGVAVIGKVLGAGLAIRLFKYSWRESMVVGVGMNGRGAVELVVATVVVELSARLLDQGVITETLLTGDQFSALVLMAFLTTFMSPFLLKLTVKKSCNIDEYTDYCRLVDETPQK